MELDGYIFSEREKNVYYDLAGIPTFRERIERAKYEIDDCCIGRDEPYNRIRISHVERSR
jgi:hypothetical protein